MTTAMSQRRPAIRRRQPNRQLVALRINAGLSRDQLGARTGVSRETIRLAEAGFVPGPRVQFALASEFQKMPLDIWPLDQQRAIR
jgi:DNA-binding XRE family transcriptional regulator